MENLKGFCIFPQLDAIKKFSFDEYSRQEYEHYSLSAGRIISIPTSTERTLIVDWEGDDEQWAGYIRGNLYADNKFIGNFHAVREANQKPEIINGVYTFINEGLELKGIWYNADNTADGFYIRLVTPQAKKQLTTPQNSTRINKVKKELRRADTMKEILNSDLFGLIMKKTEAIKKKDKRQILNHYDQILRLKLQPTSSDQLILAASLAYSWMPTILDLYGDSKKGFSQELMAVKKLGSVSSLEKLENKDIENSLITLATLINHSVVGTSKTLHIFYPGNIPIIDSNVLKGWNKIFSKYYKRYPELRLPENISPNIERQVNTYLRYWKLLMCWSYNTGIDNLRKFEEPFYWIGKSTMLTKNKSH